MDAKTAWDALVKHCRWLGIPIIHRKPATAILNGRPIKVLATTKILTDWGKNFNGALKIDLYFYKKERITWDKVSTLVHEIGHVLDYRENLLVSNRNIVSGERLANNNGMKIARLLGITTKHISCHLNKIISEYEKVFGKRTNKKITLLWRDLNAKPKSKSIRTGRHSGSTAKNKRSLRGTNSTT